MAWRPDDPVTRYSPTFGADVVGVVLADGRIETVNAAGQLVQTRADGWALGLGAMERRCGDCNRLYRTDDRREVLCMACLREHAGRCSGGRPYRRKERV